MSHKLTKTNVEVCDFHIYVHNLTEINLFSVYWLINRNYFKFLTDPTTYWPLGDTQQTTSGQSSLFKVKVSSDTPFGVTFFANQVLLPWSIVRPHIDFRGWSYSTTSTNYRQNIYFCTPFNVILITYEESPLIISTRLRIDCPWLVTLDHFTEIWANYLPFDGARILTFVFPIQWRLQTRDSPFCQKCVKKGTFRIYR